MDEFALPPAVLAPPCRISQVGRCPRSFFLVPGTNPLIGRHDAIRLDLRNFGRIPPWMP
jgi:hypothetical protein